MYFITKKDSETGKKFQEIVQKANAIREEQIKLANEYGFHEWSYGYGCAFGGFSSLVFEKEPDKTLYRKERYGGWLPRGNTKAGKAINEKLDACPRITWYELNSCIGFESVFHCIGFAWNNKEYFGFSAKEDWGVKPPLDCEEVTTTKYNSLFKTTI